MKRAEITPEAVSALDLTHHRAAIYVQLATLFRRFIVTGQWPLERQIPTHEAIAAQFDVNPATVRKAFALLEDEGLVQRFRRRGTFVVAKPAGGEAVRIPTRWEEALSAWEGLEAKVLEQNAVKHVPAPFHEVARQARGYSHSRRVHSRGGRAVALEESWLDKAVSRGRGPPLRLLERSSAVRIERSEQTVRFGIADRDLAAILDIPLNAPIAVAHLSVMGKGGVLHYESVTFYRGDAARVAEAIRFEQRAGGRAESAERRR